MQSFASSIPAHDLSGDRRGYDGIMIMIRIMSRRGNDSPFATRGACFYDARVLELEVYAAGVRALNKILESD